ncbi:hypothetical protein [Micromonospora parathelypteridis]|uniref:DUF4034 domain-containing protein n=1 Tax=Micromonospora parathelypteridis TaxID=1839617 RepID=A0A840VQT6_9ACTN|nr:hypothetical protein [Micromonospora parathelypteridis]MBB5479422.1 hypothetical protein [Micromonospora parathelypteridis]GGO29830.1 hypothetical protein GCM10011576_56820 [Micromonospora parathelypteridis]
MIVSPTTLTTDPVVANPELAPLREAVRAGDWPAVRDQLAACEGDARTRAIRAVSQKAPTGFLESVVKADPADTAAAAMLADRLTEKAWLVRTRKMAQDVSPEQFKRFHEMLAEAERVTADSVAHDGSDPAVWTVRLVIARGLQMGEAETRRRYEQVAARDPHHLSAQSQLLQRLCPKWGGSVEAMHEFARQCAAAAPEGAHNAVLIAEAHLEHALSLPGGRQAYLSRREVVAELQEALGRTVLHPAFQRTPGWVEVHHSFALLFGLIGDRKTARPLFEATGNLVSEMPWRYFGDPVDVFQEHRARAMRKWRLW